MSIRPKQSTKWRHSKLSLMALLWLIFACKEPHKESPLTDTQARISNWALTISTPQNLEWELSGKEVSSSAQRVYLKKPVISERHSGFSLMGSHGIWELPKQNLQLHQGLLQQGTDSMSVPYSQFDLKDQQWQGKDFVLKGLHWQLKGKAFQASLPLKTWQASQVHATFELASD